MRSSLYVPLLIKKSKMTMKSSIAYFIGSSLFFLSGISMVGCGDDDECTGVGLTIPLTIAAEWPKEKVASPIVEIKSPDMFPPSQSSLLQYVCSEKEGCTLELPPTHGLNEAQQKAYLENYKAAFKVDDSKAYFLVELKDLIPSTITVTLLDGNAIFKESTMEDIKYTNSCVGDEEGFAQFKFDK